MKIRILQCIETISSGGVEQTRLTLAKYLPKNRFEIKIICTYAGGPVAESLRNEGVELIVVGSMKHPFNWRIHKHVQAVISTFKPHIIHGAIFEGNSMAAISGFITRVPCIILEETSDPQNRSSKANWLLRQLMRVADAIIAISPDVKQYLIAKAKIPSSKISMVFNGVTVPYRIPSLVIASKKEELGIKDDEIVIGFVGRLYNDHKRVTDLIEAIAIINDKKVKLLIVGDGNDKFLIIDQIKKFNLDNQVVVTGFQENTSLFYSLMDILCVPSSREGFGLVAVEGMLHQKPVVASKVGGLQNIISESENGFLVPPLHPEILAGKLKILIDSKSLRVTMGQRGYQLAMQNYTGEKYAEKIGELYLSILKSKKAFSDENKSKSIA
ncbi:Glycosyltransferase [Lunatimonas lonarensis]|uniref:Glycosyltransferase n=1 Tax=Lunatimonas lonarensis TaxID=1232681 RepID=R7ZYY3_9BACT|nr:glycosyltransferase [Lunatimonas lonarensis]EON79306.1 Glycosyltransferase [Lunatimonas lonarensis]